MRLPREAWALRSPAGEMAQIVGPSEHAGCVEVLVHDRWFDMWMSTSVEVKLIRGYARELAEALLAE